MSECFFLCVVGYLVGSIPFGFLLSKWKNGVDLRDVGSASTGATNVLRTSGKKLACLTLVCDVLKGFLFTLFVILFYNVESSLIPSFFCILGHVYPVWLGFKGGKGVASSAGIFLALSPISAMIGMVIWIVTLKITKISSIGSLAFVVTVLISSAFLSVKGYHGYLIPLFSAAVVGLVILTHGGNIRRLLHKEEQKIEYRD